MKSLRYHPLFADDVLEAAGWYGAQNPTLGNTVAAAADGRIV